MGRERIIGAKNEEQVSAFRFKPIEVPQGGLFGDDRELSTAEHNYITVCDQLKKVSRGEPAKEINLKQLSHFFTIQYEYIFNINCLDYNWFNFQNTIKGVKSFIPNKLPHNKENRKITNLDMARFLYDTMLKFEKNSGNKIFEKNLSLSTLKQPWILEELCNNSETKWGFY